MKSREILNDENRIAQRNNGFMILSDLFAGKENNYLRKHVMTIGGIVGHPKDLQTAYRDPDKWVAECMDDLAEQICTSETPLRFAPACIEYSIYGVHFIDKLFGAEVFFQNDQWYTKKLETPVGELRFPDLENDETWGLARRATLAFLAHNVKLPLFGMPTLSSALNIIVNLYSGNALITMMEELEAFAQDLKTINDVIITLHQWYKKNVPETQLQPVVSWSRTQPPGYGQLCGCTTQLVSGSAYREFIAPLDDKLLGIYPGGGMMHLCGMHTQHIETLRDMKHLKAIQINDRATVDLKAYFEGLRDDQIIYLNPCESMTVNMAIEITGGRRLVICDAINAPEIP